MAAKSYVIALEEHYQDPEVKQLGGGPGAGARSSNGSTISARCASARWTRPASTCRSSRTARPRLQKLEPNRRCALARRANDRLHEAVQRPPRPLRRLCRAADPRSRRPRPTSSSAR